MTDSLPATDRPRVVARGERAHRRETLACFLLVLVYLVLRAPSLEFFLGNSDHGMQLSMGRQILFGRLPFVDVLYHYGPLVAYVSALGLFVHDSLAPEALLCAVGYAACVALLFRSARRELSGWAASGIALVAVLCLGRFYKWYYWLFPLIAIELGGRHLRSGGQTPGLVCAGLVGGIAWLFRADLGLLFLVLFAIIAALDRIGLGGVVAWLRDVGTLAGALSGTLALWLASLWLGGGFDAILNYFDATFRGGAREAVNLALPLPSLTDRSAGGAGVVTVLLFVLMLAAEIACLLAGLVSWWRGDRRPTPRSSLMLASSLTGLGVFPQAMHRTDLPHVIQVLPPLLLALPLLGKAAWVAAPRLERRVGHLLRAGVVLGLAGAVALAAAAMPLLPRDLDVDVRHAARKWRRLAQGLAAAGDEPAAVMARAIQRSSELDARVLPALPLSYHVTFFANRPVSGMFTTYAGGLMDWPRLRAMNFERVKSDPPLLVITNERFDDPDAPWSFRRSQPELYEYISSNYRRVLFAQGGLRLLGRAQ